MDPGKHFKCWGNSGSPIKKKQLRILGFQKGSLRPEPGLQLPSGVLAFPNYPSEKPIEEEERKTKEEEYRLLEKGSSRPGPDPEQEKLQRVVLAFPNYPSLKFRETNKEEDRETKEEGYRLLERVVQGQGQIQSRRSCKG